MIDEKISKVIGLLKEKGLDIKEYSEPYKYPSFTEGFMIQLNNLPYLLLYSVIEDMLDNQEKLINFVETIKKVSNYE